MCRAKIRLRVGRLQEFMWFPEAVVRGALGYYWHYEGSDYEPLYRLFFGSDVNRDAQGNLIATPPHGGRIVIKACDDCEGCADLELTLFGRNENLFPKFVDSLQAIGREGIGEDPIHFDIEGAGELRCGTLQDFLTPEPSVLSKSCKLTIDAPMTLRKVGGKLLRDWDTQSFAGNLVQRAVQLNRHYGSGEIPDWDMEALVGDFENVHCWNDTALVHRERASSRQRRYIDYSGFCGVVFMHDITRENYTLLRIGEQLAVGKNTVFGSGGYSLKSI